MPYEQFLYTKLSNKSDIYSLGSTYFYLFTGELPYQSSDPFDIIRKKQHELPDEPYNLNKDIPLVLSGLILKMLAFKPEDRPSATQIVNILMSIMKKQETDIS